MTTPPTHPLPATLDAARALLDHLIVDPDRNPIGRVDDLELRMPEAGGAPVITALLSGPLALGPRLGGRLGTWWLSVGRRLRSDERPGPVRVPIDVVTGIRPGEVVVGVRPEDVDATRLSDWTREKLIAPLPASGRSDDSS
jgi:hypothetical protein